MLILASYSLHRAIATGTLARSCPKCLSSIPVISGTFRRATFYHTANSHTNRSHQIGVRRCLSASAVRQMEGVTYLTQEQAIAVDEDLMGPLGFSVDQLMELAGLSVAQAIYTEYPPTTHRRVLIVAGPGNNGGDGLVAARHLHHFGYTAQVLYPKPTDKPLYNGLVTQLRALEVPLVAWSSISESPLAGRYDIVIDAMFGFSFKGQPRAPFAEILAALHPDSNPPPIISVDIPSGWDVEQGDVSGGGLRPEMLVSLTAPKNAAKKFEGRHHYVGGRFVPPAVKTKFDLKLPPYAGSDQVVKLNSAAVGLDPSQMRLVSKDTPLAEGDVNRDPFIQFDLWLKSAVGLVQEPTAMCLATVGPDSQPNARYVLLKEYNEKGFVFYSNNDSTKGEELERVRKAALCFYWEPLERQVRTQGTVIPVSDEDADAYFHSRPRSSQIGAWVSHQSAVIASRSELDDAAKVLEETYSDVTKAVPRPPHWVGYRLIPDNIEFWQGRASRLHDRIIFKRSESGKNCWSMERLSP